MERTTNRSSVGRGVWLAAYIGAGFVLIVVTVLGLNHAFALMSRKSDRDFFVGLTIIAVLFAIYIPLAVTAYRKLTMGPQKESDETTDPGQCHPYKTLTERGPQEPDEEEHDGKT